MNAEALVWIFGIGLLLCMLLLVFVVIYFLKEWKILEIGRASCRERVLPRV